MSDQRQYRPRLSVEIPAEVKEVLDQHLRPHGMQKLFWGVVAEDVAHILASKNGKKFLLAVIDRKISLSDIYTALNS